MLPKDTEMSTTSLRSPKTSRPFGNARALRCRVRHPLRMSGPSGVPFLGSKDVLGYHPGPRAPGHPKLVRWARGWMPGSQSPPEEMGLEP